MSRDVEKARTTREDADKAIARIRYGASIREGAGCEFAVEAATENIEVLYGVELEQANGIASLESIAVKTVATGAVVEQPMSAVFVFIGVKPHTDRFAGTLALDGQGFILTGAELPRGRGAPGEWPLVREPYAFETSMPGVFAAGDVRATANRRVAAAVGEGSAAVYSVHRYLRTV